MSRRWASPSPTSSTAPWPRRAQAGDREAHACHVTLPAGLIAEIVHINPHQLPLAFGLDVVVETKDGKPFAGLEEKDFSVLVNGSRSMLRTAMGSTAEDPSTALNVVIALDCSGSMQGAFKDAKAAAIKILAAIKAAPT